MSLGQTRSQGSGPADVSLKSRKGDIGDGLAVIPPGEKQLDAIFSELDQSHLPGAAVGVALGGVPFYRKGFGLANMELPVALTPSMRMRLFSISKHFACLSYLLLCEEGRAALDAPIGQHLPELHPVAREVTARQLMSNTSGLRDSHDIAWLFSGTDSSFSSADLLQFYCTINDANAPAGTAWIYNNGGFLLITAAVERISGQPMEEFLRRRILEPAGMFSTQLRRTNTDFLPNSATMHMTRPGGGFERSYLGGERAGEGGIVSTVDDMLRWLAHMDAPVVGREASWTAMKTPHRLPNGTSTGYGLGLFSGNYRGVETLFHSGGGMGANAFMIKVPSVRLDVVVLVNRHDVDSSGLAYKVVDCCVRGLASPATVAPRPVISGVYRSRATGRVLQLFGKDCRQRAWIDNYDLALRTSEDGGLLPAEGFEFLKQEIVPLDAEASPRRIRFNDFGNVDVLERLPPATQPIDPAVGRYRSDETGTDAEVFASGTGPQLRSVGRFGSRTFDLSPLADRVWHAQGRLPWMGGIVSFDDSGFRLTTARNWALPFRRVS